MKTFPDKQKSSGLDDKIHTHSIQLVGCMCVCEQRGGLLGARNSVS